MSRSLEDMSEIADRFVGLVQDSCERTIVAGSIRRKRPEVRDIDIVAIPKIVATEKPGYFAPVKTTQSLLHNRIENLISIALSIVTPRVKTDGKTMIGRGVAFVEFEGAPVDLYYATEQTWWGLVQMRTGSARFNTMLATRALSMGMKYHGDGNGVTKKGVRLDDGKSEEGIFKALGLKYLEPWDRD